MCCCATPTLATGAATEAPSDLEDPLEFHRDATSLEMPSAMVELPKNYRFSYPSSWTLGAVSRNDANAYGMDAHVYRSEDVLAGRCEAMVNLLPFAGAVPTSEDTIARFLQNASMSPSLSLMDATQTGKDKQVVDGRTYWSFEYENPHALVVTTVADGALYAITATTSDSRQWRRLQGELRRVVSSFRVPSL